MSSHNNSVAMEIEEVEVTRKEYLMAKRLLPSARNGNQRRLIRNVIEFYENAKKVKLKSPIEDTDTESSNYVQSDTNADGDKEDSEVDSNDDSEQESVFCSDSEVDSEIGVDIELELDIDYASDYIPTPEEMSPEIVEPSPKKPTVHRGPMELNLMNVVIENKYGIFSNDQHGIYATNTEVVQEPTEYTSEDDSEREMRIANALSSGRYGIILPATGFYASYELPMDVVKVEVEEVPSSDELPMREIKQEIEESSPDYEPTMTAVKIEIEEEMWEEEEEEIYDEPENNEDINEHMDITETPKRTFENVQEKLARLEHLRRELF